MENLIKKIECTFCTRKIIVTRFIKNITCDTCKLENKADHGEEPFYIINLQTQETVQLS